MQVGTGWTAQRYMHASRYWALITGSEKREAIDSGSCIEQDHTTLARWLGWSSTKYRRLREGCVFAKMRWRSQRRDWSPATQPFYFSTTLRLPRHSPSASPCHHSTNFPATSGCNDDELLHYNLQASDNSIATRKWLDDNVARG